MTHNHSPSPLPTPFRRLSSHSFLHSPPQPTQSIPSLPQNHCPHHHHQPEHPEPKFRPEVNDIPFPLYPTQWQHLLKSKKQHWEQLTKDNQERNFLRAEQKAWLQREQMKECTFEPELCREDEGQSGPAPFDRLFEQGERRRVEQAERERRALEEEKRQIASQQMMGRQLSDFTMLNREKFDLNPLYMRLEKVVQERVQQRKLMVQKEVSYPFRPRINEKSVGLANKKDRINNIVDRLLQDSKERETKNVELREKYSKDLEKSLTFKPNISSFMPLHPPSQSTLDSHCVSEQFTHHPQINHISALITQDRKHQSSQQQIQRLHSAPTIKRSQKLTVIEAELYAECSFNPEINSLSREMVGPPTKVHLCATPQKPTPSYRPRINEVSRAMTVTKRAQSLDHSKQKVKEKAQSYLREVEYNQLKECTFRPQIIEQEEARAALRTTTLSEVSGFKDFRKKVERVQEKERSRRELEVKLFKLEKSYDERMLRKSRSRVSDGGSSRVMC